MPIEMADVIRKEINTSLKKCPFCGRRAELRYDKDGFSYILCANDGCYARTDGCLNEYEAARCWNRRANDEQR